MQKGYAKVVEWYGGKDRFLSAAQKNNAYRNDGLYRQLADAARTAMCQ